MTPWQWWAGELAEVEADGMYRLGEFPTREAAIAAAEREYGPGVPCCVVEARSSTSMKYEGGDFVPFMRIRNKAVFDTVTRRCPCDSEPCANPSCKPGTCFSDSPGRRCVDPGRPE